MRRFSIADIIVSIVVIVLIALTLAPAIARIQRPYAEARCQSNMRRMAEAMALYTADNNNRYPTNRIANGTMFYRVQLTPVTNPQMRYMYGINWVEALYPYLQKAAEKTGQDYKAFLKCPNASSITSPRTGSPAATASVTYAFNGYLAEYSPSLVQNSEKLMMIREMDRLINAEFRPFNIAMHVPGGPNNGIRPAIGTVADKPYDPFLNITDAIIGTAVNNKPHNEGSHILFADGHTKHFTSDLMPRDSSVTSANSWDAETMQWYNFNKNNTTVGTEQRRTIAITP